MTRGRRWLILSSFVSQHPPPSTGTLGLVRLGPDSCQRLYILYTRTEILVYSSSLKYR